MGHNKSQQEKHPYVKMMEGARAILNNGTDPDEARKVIAENLTKILSNKESRSSFAQGGLETLEALLQVSRALGWIPYNQEYGDYGGMHPAQAAFGATNFAPTLIAKCGGRPVFDAVLNMWDVNDRAKILATPWLLKDMTQEGPINARLSAETVYKKIFRDGRSYTDVHKSDIMKAAGVYDMLRESGIKETELDAYFRDESNGGLTENPGLHLVVSH